MVALIIAGFILIIFFGTLLLLDSPGSIGKAFDSAVLALILSVVIVAVLTASSKKLNEKAT